MHLGDLGLLCVDDRVGERKDVGVRTVGLDCLGLADGALVVGDHPLGELDVGGVERNGRDRAIGGIAGGGVGRRRVIGSARGEGDDESEGDAGCGKTAKGHGRPFRIEYYKM